MLLFVPDPVRRTVAAWQAALPEGACIVTRRGAFRTIVRVTLHGSLVLVPLTSGELSAELRARRDDSELRNAVAAFRVSGDWDPALLAETAPGWLREVDASPALRGLALCALVARVQAEDDDYEGHKGEPDRLLKWLEHHGAENALSEEEREWLIASIDALPEEARYASLPERFASHAFALGLVPSPEPGNLHELMSRFGFLSDALPTGLKDSRIRPGRDAHLG